jgi:hypothetical protein
MWCGKFRAPSPVLVTSQPALARLPRTGVPHHGVFTRFITRKVPAQTAGAQDVFVRIGQPAHAHQPVVRVDPFVQPDELADQFAVQAIDPSELEYQAVRELLFEQRPDLLGEVRRAAVGVRQSPGANEQPIGSALDFKIPTAADNGCLGQVCRSVNFDRSAA